MALARAPVSNQLYLGEMPMRKRRLLSVLLVTSVVSLLPLLAAIPQPVNDAHQGLVIELDNKFRGHRRITSKITPRVLKPKWWRGAG
jgi:hypothetical protein